jgi:ABC-2 type transport system permease protein
MGVCTAFAVAAFDMLLASVCRTRAQLGALSTLVILVMSSIGGSMFPRFLMPEAMQKAGPADRQCLGDRRIHQGLLA